MKKIKKIKSPKEILFWLKNNDYSRIPTELWDKYLWSYEILLNKMSEELTGWENNKLDMYLIMEENNTKGFCIYDGKEKTLYFDGDSYDGFEMVYNKISKDNLVVSSISFKRSTISNLFSKNNMRYKMINSTNKYFIKDVPTIKINKNINIRELTVFDKEYFKEITLSDGGKLDGFSENFSEYLDEGTRYFGAFKGNKLISTVGLIMLTAFRSEIIGLQTYNLKDRRKGYASSVCRLAIEEGLKETPIITWTAVGNNVASNKTAKKLGMKKYNSNYYFKLDSH